MTRLSRLPIVVLIAVVFVCLSVTDVHAGQLLLSAAGGAIGAFFGPLGFSIGWAVGGLLGGAIFGAQGPDQVGPRANNLHVTSTAFGAGMKRMWGVKRMDCQLVWVGANGKGGRGIREHRHEDSAGGKGGGSAEVITFTYDVDFAVSIAAASDILGVIRIWLGPKLIYDVSEDASLQTRIGSGIKLKGKGGTVTFYDGNEDQEPPAIIEALAGVGQTSAYRNQFLAVFEKYRFPDGIIQIPQQLSFECYTDGAESFREIATYDLHADEYTNGDVNVQMTWPYVSANGEIHLLMGVQGTGNWQTRWPSGPIAGQLLWRTYLLLPDESIVPTDRPADAATEADFPGIPFGANNWAGHSDEPAYLIGGMVLLLLERNVGVGFTALTTEQFVFTNGISSIAKFHKVLDDLWILTNASDILHYNILDGSFIEGSHVLSTLGATDMMVSDEFLWGLNATTHKLHKIDLDTLALVATIDVDSKITMMCVESDDVIYFAGFSTPPPVMHFYEYRNGVITEVGSATYVEGFVGDNQLIVKYGVWYTGNRAPIIHVWAPSVVANCVPLSTIQRDICAASGFLESEIDVTELTDCVRGYSLDQQMTGRDATLPLQRYGFYDGRERDLVLEFLKRGHDSVLTIPEADMAARVSLDDALPALIDKLRSQETELPSLVHVRFIDEDAAYQTGHAYSQRLVTESKKVVTVDVPIVMTASKGRQIADVLMANLWLERTPKEIKVSRKHIRMDAGDPVTLEVSA